MTAATGLAAEHPRRVVAVIYLLDSVILIDHFSGIDAATKFLRNHRNGNDARFTHFSGDLSRLL